MKVQLFGPWYLPFTTCQRDLVVLATYVGNRYEKAGIAVVLFYPLDPHWHLLNTDFKVFFLTLGFMTTLCILLSNYTLCSPLLSHFSRFAFLSHSMSNYDHCLNFNVLRLNSSVHPVCSWITWLSLLHFCISTYLRNMCKVDLKNRKTEGEIPQCQT